MDVQKPLCLLVLFAFFGAAEAVYKRWLADTNFESDSNWNAGRPPCGNDRVIIPDDSPVIYMQMNTTLRELTLPKNGQLILGSGIQIAFTEDPSTDPACPPAGGDVEFNATNPEKWVDPSNWCATTTELADCQPPALLETERVPCVNDDVVFLRHRSYYVDLSHDLQIQVKTLKVTGTAFTTESFAQFANSTDGRKMFSPTSDGAPTSVTVTRLGCDDIGGCPCGNDKGKIQSQICAILSKRCGRAACKNPVTPIGACCEMCGVIINATRGRGFNFNDFKNSLTSTYLDNQTDVTAAISVTSQGSVQIVLQDESGKASAALAALIIADIDKDLKNGGHKYALDSYTTTASSAASTAAHEGGTTLQAGPITGIVLGVILLVVIVVIVVLVFKRGRPKFKLPHAPNLPSLPNLSQYLPNRAFAPRKMREPPSGSATPPRTLGPIDPGFANPLYDTSPFDDGMGREMELRAPIEEQPTFDISGPGFNNPLYGTAGASFFADPAEVQDSAKVDVETPTAKDDGSKA